MLIDENLFPSPTGDSIAASKRDGEVVNTSYEPAASERISDQALPYGKVGRLGKVTPDGHMIVERAKR
jgi:hypothetical protein